MRCKCSDTSRVLHETSRAPKLAHYFPSPVREGTMRRLSAHIALVTMASVWTTALAAQASSRGDTVSAAISAVRYDVTFTRDLAQEQRIGVAMSFTVTGTGAVVLSLPAWTP